MDMIRPTPVSTPQNNLKELIDEIRLLKEEQVKSQELFKLADLLILHEGFRSAPYYCTAGKRTIGIGYNMDSHNDQMEKIDMQQAIALVVQETAKAEAWYQANWKGYDKLSTTRKLVLVDMAYNMGTGTMSQFVRLKKSVETQDWSLGVLSMESSTWYKQVGNRAKRLVKMWQTDTFPEAEVKKYLRS